MPGLLNVHPSSHHACKYDASDFIFGNRFNGDAKATRVGFSVRPDRLDRGIANETSEVHWAFVWIA
jgi:hypothetical protein